MKKVKSLLNKIEESYLFRYGKRAWQLLSVVAFVFLVYAIIQYAWNSVPSFRHEVTISKIEFDRNKIDSDFDITNDIEKCTLGDYKTALDSLKKMMPESEWTKLGDSVEVTNYSYEDIYDPYWGYSYPQKVYYKSKEYQRNRDAIPNILEEVFESRAIDSAQFCERIKVVRLARELVSFTDKKEATRLMRGYFRGYLEYNGQLDALDVKKLANLFQLVHGSRPKFKEPHSEGDNWVEFSYYLNIGRLDSLPQERYDITQEAVKKLKAKVKFKEKEDAHAITRIVLGSSLKDEDIKKETLDFFADKDIKMTEKNVLETFNKYHVLYEEKVELAERLLADEKFEKEINRSHYYSRGSNAFMAILGIAAILILFSIRQIIKVKTEE